MQIIMEFNDRNGLYICSNNALKNKIFISAMLFDLWVSVIVQLKLDLGIISVQLLVISKCGDMTTGWS